ncbi:MAG: hypothetical protein ACPLRJ_02865 [Infirmifilum uzonense]|uniref:hypothetical protein n=1 Tax=Infirmifilum uzonense TaxID=1550241 RepID=UPI003C740AD0
MQVLQADDYRYGLNLLKKYSEISIISYVLEVISSIFLAPYTMLLYSLTAYATSQHILEEIMASLQRYLVLSVIGGVLALVGFVLGLIAILFYLIPSAGRLAKWSSTLSTPSKLLKYGYYAGFIFGAISAALIILAVITSNGTTPLPGMIVKQPGAREGYQGLLVIIILGLVVTLLVMGLGILLGWVGTIMFLLELGSLTKEGLFKAVAILDVLSSGLSLVNIRVRPPYANPVAIILFLMLFPAIRLTTLLLLRKATLKVLSVEAVQP